MAARIIQGDVCDVLPTLPAGSVDCVVTSPPYWMLRSYLPKGHALKPLELGSEPTPAAFVANMVRVFGLVREAMADHACMFLNIGDSYSANGWECRRENKIGLGSMLAGERKNKDPYGIPEGNLCLIPQRLAIALQDDGWIVRSVIVWHKPAPMPASLSGWRWQRCKVKTAPGKFPKYAPRLGNETDVPGDFKHMAANGLTAQWSDCPGCDKCTPHGGYRLRRGSWRCTSSWEPILMLAKSSGYYADGEACRQPSAITRSSGPWGPRGDSERDPGERDDLPDERYEPTGSANLRDVWTIAAEPLKAAHYAAFPTELVHRCLKAGASAKGYCPHCGKPWCRVVDVGEPIGNGVRTRNSGGRDDRYTVVAGDAPVMPKTTIDWRPSCPCPPHEPRPGVVLDPFSGSGRTGIESLRLGLDFVGVELNPEYVTMARKLLREESPLFAGAD